MKALWPGRYSGLTAFADSQFNMEETVRGLFAGDALTRALMADALTKHGDPAWRQAFLIEAFAGENYPIVRYFAANGLAASNPALSKLDYLADEATRAQQIAVWAPTVDPSRLAAVKKIAAELRSKRKDVDLEVGE